MAFSFWQTVCAVLVLVDAISSIVVMRRNAVWSRNTIILAVLGFGGEALVLLYIFGVIY